MENKTNGIKEIYLATEQSNPEKEPVQKETEENATEQICRVGENLMLRTENSKVFHLSDGRTQEVFYSQPIHTLKDNALVDINNALKEDDENHVGNVLGAFAVQFNKDDASNELFSVESENCKLTVSARKNARQKVGVGAKLKKDNSMVFTGAATDTELRYSVLGDRVKEDIVIKKPKSTYCYAYDIATENLDVDFLKEKNEVYFSSKETGDELFRIPAPFMTDAAGVTSTEVAYSLCDVTENGAVLEILPSAEWLNAEERAFPVVIDPQIVQSGKSCISTYSAQNGNLTTPAQHSLTSRYSAATCCNGEYMFIELSYPVRGMNYRVRKAELKLTQTAGTLKNSARKPKLKLYSCGTEFKNYQDTVLSESNLIDYNIVQSGTAEYTFDITSLVDALIADFAWYKCLAVKIENSAAGEYGEISLAGATATAGSPELSITYDAFDGMVTDSPVYTHDLKRMGTGSVDLVHGNLFLDATDFAWSGNKMPITIKHYYNSELSGTSFSANAAKGLYTADYSNMKVGYGWMLSCMQSMVSATFESDGEMCQGYVFTEDSGKLIKFKENPAEEYTRRGDNYDCCYQLYTDIDGNGYAYDPYHRTLEKDDRVYLFDSAGYLLSITNEHGIQQTFKYSKNGQLSFITDGAGRSFAFSYNSDSYLSAIVAPDGTSVKYEYKEGNLVRIVYPESTAKIVYNNNCDTPSPTMIRISDNDYPGGSVNKYFVYYGYHNYRVISVTEKSDENDNAASGEHTLLSYNIAGKNTVLTTYLQADNEDKAETLKTVYTFSDDGELLNTYMYAKNDGNRGVSVGSGINPYSGGDSTAVSNINNLLLNHGFLNGSSNWTLTPADNTAFFSVIESTALYGTKAARLNLSNAAYGEEYGLSQTGKTLPAGEYTFSAFVKTDKLEALTAPTDAQSDSENCGVYLRVEDADANVLYETEHLTETFGEYIRLAAPIKLDTAKKVKVSVLAQGQGIVFVNAPQLENNGFVNQYNLLENGNFENDTSGWTRSGGTTITTANKFNMENALLMNGSLDARRYVYQTLPLKKDKSTRENFTLSGWAKGMALPLRDRADASAPTFRLRAVLSYADCTTEEFCADFSPHTEEWQRASVEIAKSEYKSATELTVYCEYDYNSACAYFDDIQLVPGEIETGLSASDFPVENGDDGDTTTADSTETTEENAFKELTDKIGNALTGTQFTDGEFGAIYTANAYTEEGSTVQSALCGNDLISEIDARGNVTKYEVDERTSRNKSVTDRLGNTVDYKYDADGNITSVAHRRFDNTYFADVNYTYHPNNGLDTITRGDGMKYELSYDSFANLQSIGIGGKAEKLISYVYRKGSHNAKQITYANGDYTQLKYNSTGQVVLEAWFKKDGTAMAKYRYGYDQNGNLVKSLDILNKTEYNYYYKGEKLSRMTESSVELQTVDGYTAETVTSKTLKATVLYQYNSKGELQKKRFLVDGQDHAYFVEHRDDGSQVYTLPTGVVSHSKNDHLGRLEFDELQLGKGFISRRFSYHDGEATYKHIDNNMLKSSPTTTLVSSILLSDGSTLSYEYDAEEKITAVTEKRMVSGAPVETKYEYTYDNLGQLLTETVNGTAVNTMTYDYYGNILSKNGKKYEYSNSAWKDLLTAYNGQEITYDAGGNPISYLGHTLAWEKGRQLKSFDDITYTYNANGIRTAKTVDGVRHDYIVDGTNIQRETWNQDGVQHTLVPLYDNTEAVCGIIHNDAAYYFLKNLQGDVIAITDDVGQVVARYTYDAWGVCTVESDQTDCGIASLNPYRYRAYYYDSEIGMYYLQSRYYDPQVGRFINADEVLFSFLLNFSCCGNMFAYCCNSPIMLTDALGYAPKSSEVPPSTSGYVPPKGGAVKGKTKSGKTGWKDKSGNIWVPDPSNHGGDHWDVTGKDGYINVGRNGHAWGGKGKVTLPKAARKHIEWGKIVKGAFVVIITSFVMVGIAYLMSLVLSAPVLIFV